MSHLILRFCSPISSATAAPHPRPPNLFHCHVLGHSRQMSYSSEPFHFDEGDNINIKGYQLRAGPLYPDAFIANFSEYPTQESLPKS